MFITRQILIVAIIRDLKNESTGDTLDVEPFRNEGTSRTPLFKARPAFLKIGLRGIKDSDFKADSKKGVP